MEGGMKLVTQNVLLGDHFLSVKMICWRAGGQTEKLFGLSILMERGEETSFICSSLPLDFLKVELKLFAFKDVAITASRLAGAG